MFSKTCTTVNIEAFAITQAQKDIVIQCMKITTSLPKRRRCRVILSYKYLWPTFNVNVKLTNNLSNFMKATVFILFKITTSLSTKRRYQMIFLFQHRFCFFLSFIMLFSLPARKKLGHEKIRFPSELPPTLIKNIETTYIKHTLSCESALVRLTE